MAVTPADVGTTLGRPLSAAETAQAEQWIAAALMLIGAELGDVTELDQAMLDYVVRESVAERIRMTGVDGASSITVAVDDGSMTRRWDGSRVTSGDWLLVDWQNLLSPVIESGVFSARPSFAADTPDLESWA